MKPHREILSSSRIIISVTKNLASQGIKDHTSM